MPRRMTSLTEGRASKTLSRSFVSMENSVLSYLVIRTGPRESNPTSGTVGPNTEHLEVRHRQ